MLGITFYFFGKLKSVATSELVTLLQLFNAGLLEGHSEKRAIFGPVGCVAILPNFMDS